MPSPKLRARKDDDRECDLVAGQNGDTKNDVRLWTLGKSKCPPVTFSCVATTRLCRAPDAVILRRANSKGVDLSEPGSVTFLG